ncbi:related to carboxypeptidase A [Cephalotrichum gorgonifer]|uniref:Related to carboxypeptidase A n=1 Tax=Cephalotrichum gorgonifer TaxID=2041049 RepID=A0AAE8MSR4_9PEZI|nr:related to carboxypeptidase A [Cephalotrichum gorgonifer]
MVAVTPFLLQIPLLVGAVSACLLPWEREGGPRPDMHLMSRQASETIPIGTGNRWKNKVPRGLGTQPGDTTVTSVMNPAELRSAIDSLAKEFKIEVFNAPEETAEGATMFGAKVGGGKAKGKGDTLYSAFFTAGIHARERGGPDNLVYFIADLLWAKREKTGVTYGGRRYTNKEVNQALDVGIVFMPLLNPDGVAYDQETDKCWRRNRNPTAPVDLNRNFDFLWDYKKSFSPEVTGGNTGIASDDPASDVYHGTKVFSEPETRNVKWALNKFKSISWTLDIHSFAGLVLYSWGDDFNQITDPNMNILNEEYDGVRGVLVDTNETEYRSYQELDVWKQDSFVSVRVADAMNSAITGLRTPMTATQSINLYATSGALSDYVSARNLLDSKLGAAHGLTLEFGQDNNEAVVCPFYVKEAEFNNNIRQVGAGLMEFLLAAAEAGLRGR